MKWNLCPVIASLESNVFVKRNQVKNFYSNVKDVLLYDCEIWKTNQILDHKLQISVTIA
jgi:hypothetical protein